MSTPDYYAILGISPDASEAEIKKQYRDLMIKYHPDRNHSPDAEKRSKQINEAYSVLSDPMKRAQYDRRSSGPQWYTQQHKAYRTGTRRTNTYRTYTWTYRPSGGVGRRKKSASPFRGIFGFILKVVLVIVVLWILLHFAILTIGVVLTLLFFYMLWVFLTELLHLLYGRR